MLNHKYSVITFGDIIDLYLKLKEKGLSFVFSKIFKFTYKKKVSSKWDNYSTESDFWVIPEIKKHWNKIISGNKDISYEEYVSQKYFKDKKKLKLLSIGCGEGLHERNFYNYLEFEKIIGIDISKESIKNAAVLAKNEKKNITYICSGFTKAKFISENFDIILFDSSLHHFENIGQFLKNHIKPLLKKDGLLIVFEYCGPNRLQWRKVQLDKCNEVLKNIPVEYKKFSKTNLTKKKIYRPGILRMLAIDPSEAPDSENLAQAIHSNFEIIEEKKMGWNIIQPLLKGIAQNFLSDEKETEKYINFILDEENKFLLNNSSDAIFGVYRLKN